MAYFENIIIKNGLFISLCIAYSFQGNKTTSKKDYIESSVKKKSRKKMTIQSMGNQESPNT
jgi:hypothetical protein